MSTDLSAIRKLCQGILCLTFQHNLISFAISEEASIAKIPPVFTDLWPLLVAEFTEVTEKMWVNHKQLISAIFSARRWIKGQMCQSLIQTTNINVGEGMNCSTQKYFKDIMLF